MHPGTTIRLSLTPVRSLLQVLSLAATMSACSSGGDSASTPSPPPSPPVAGVAGLLQYEFPPPNNNCDGLNFAAVELRPIRLATVQLIDANDQSVLDSTVSDVNGNYSLDVGPRSDVLVRVRAELKNTNPSWDVEVRNNVVDPGDPNPPALQNRPIYVMDSAVFDVGDQGEVRNLTAATGWGGNSYVDARAAAPFSILDAIYSAMSLIIAEEPDTDFAPLDAFWSPDNSTTFGSGSDDELIDSGEIGTSFYWADQLFLVGLDGDDTDEFDDHVVVHEWGHYFEDNFSRSDSIGGAHTIGDELDMRVAFGEGWATALSGMALDNPSYCDTLWSGGQLRGFEINAESEAGGTRGWFNEVSVMKLLYDLWDTSDDGADNSSIGFAPIYSVMTGAQAATPAFTSIFSFATELKQSLNAQGNTFVDALLAEQNIETNIDIWGSTESNDGPGTPADVLPIYTDIALGVTTQICANSQFDSGRDGNKVSEHRFLKLNVPATQAVTFSMLANPAPSTPSVGFDCTDENDPEYNEHSDPDLIVWQDGNFVLWGISCEPNSEVTNPRNLSAGNYVIDINEFRHEDEGSPAGFPEQICFDFTAN
jgi:hypothetical protein